MIVERDLERDIDWRFEELAVLRLWVSATTPKSVASRAGLRALWAMLYAHYEGFCKFALDLYLDYLEKQRIIRTQLREEIAAYSLEAVFRTLRGNMSRESLWKFFKTELPAMLQATASFDTKLDTNSNLWPALLKQHCDTVGLKVSSIDEHVLKLRTLVARRNEIAHGKPNIVNSLAEYQKYEDAVSAVVYELALAISAAVEDKEYLSSSTPGAA